MDGTRISINAYVNDNNVDFLNIDDGNICFISCNVGYILGDDDDDDDGGNDDNAFPCNVE